MNSPDSRAAVERATARRNALAGAGLAALCAALLYWLVPLVAHWASWASPQIVTVKHRTHNEPPGEVMMNIPAVATSIGIVALCVGLFVWLTLPGGPLDALQLRLALRRQHRKRASGPGA